MFTDNFKKLAKSNTKFRNVVMTGTHSQLVAMSLPVGSDIGEDMYEDNDQVFFVVKGRVEANVAGHLRVLEKHSLLLVPAGTACNLSNVGDEAVKLLVMYAPACYPDGLVQATKEELEAMEVPASSKSIDVQFS